MQHGSILLNNKHLLLAELTNTEDLEKKDRLKNYIKLHSADLSEAAQREITYKEAEDAVVNNIRN